MWLVVGGDACAVPQGLEISLLNHKLGYYCLHCALGAWSPTSLQPRTAWSSLPRWPCRWPRTWTSSTWGHPLLAGVRIMVMRVKAMSTYCCLQFLQVTTRTTQDDSHVNLSLSFTPCHFHMVNRGHALDWTLVDLKFRLSYNSCSAIDLLSTTSDAGDGIALHDDLASLTIVVADRVATLLEV